MSNTSRTLIGGLALAILGLAAVPTLNAGPLTIGDPYTATGTTNNPDVIGDARRFDARQLVFLERSASQWVVQVHSNFNYGDASLTPFRLSSSSPYLHVGDLLFRSSSSTSWNYGVPLATHDGNSGLVTSSPYVVRGNLYSYDGSGGFTLTSNQAYGGPGTYRTGEAVWINPANALMAGAGTATSTRSGNLVITTLTFTPSAQFWNDYRQNGIYVGFASATCANDIIRGHVPEPAAYVVLAIGLAFVAFRYRKRAATAKAS